MSNYHNHMNHSWIKNLFFEKIRLQVELRSRSQKVSYQIRKPICMKKIIKKIRMLLCRLLLITCKWLTFLVHSTSQKVYTNQISFHYKSRSFRLYYPLNFLNLICFKSNKGMIFWYRFSITFDLVEHSFKLELQRNLSQGSYMKIPS